MYYYVYDRFVQDPKWAREVDLIETRLTDLGISGKIARLALFRDPVELIQDAVRRGAKTVVALGNDVTLRHVIDAVGDTGAAIGIIPLGKEQNEIADLLGVPRGVEACNILSSRIIEELDVGQVNDQRFLHQLIFPCGPGMEVHCDDFVIKPKRKGEMQIQNMTGVQEDGFCASPVDGHLDLIIRQAGKGIFGSRKTQTSAFPVDEILVKSADPVRLMADGEAFEAKELRISVLPAHLQVITGKNRQFVRSLSRD